MKEYDVHYANPRALEGARVRTVRAESMADAIERVRALCARSIVITAVVPLS